MNNLKEIKTGAILGFIFSVLIFWAGGYDFLQRGEMAVFFILISMVFSFLGAFIAFGISEGYFG